MARTLLAMRAALVFACVGAIVWSSASPAQGGEGDEPFTGSVSRIDPDTRRLMVGSSWHAEPHHGRLVLHRRWADDILLVFRRLYRSGFPIRRVRLVDRFDADDRASMRHDNTSAFNCRYVDGTTTWSQHAYGRAIDLNPVENPYVAGSHVTPRRGRRYLDRTDVRPGMIVPHDVVVRAFRRIGWGWGGRWISAKDYQHFSANGR